MVLLKYYDLASHHRSQHCSCRLVKNGISCFTSRTRLDIHWLAGKQMTVENPSVVDIVAHQADAPMVSLVIADHLDWENELEHLYTLQEKLNRYLAFVESGELKEKYPHFANKQVQIDVAFLYEPTAHARTHFLEKVQERIRAAGMDFVWHIGNAS